MLESIAATLLTKYLGNYVKELNKQNLKVSLGDGDAVLNNLELKPDALEEFNLPITVKAGYLGKLKLQIPWSNIKTQPAIVRISDIFVVGGPKSRTEVIKLPKKSLTAACYSSYNTKH